MIPTSDFALLPALDALLEEANVTKAAVKLGVSQPAMSSKLGRLRELTGDALLVPSGHGRGMVATPRAILLRAQVREAISAAEAALKPAGEFDPANGQATLRIIANDNAAALTSTVLLAELRVSHAQGLRIALLKPDGRPLSERLESGEADLAIAAADLAAGDHGLLQRAILRDRFATAQRKGHPRGSAALDLDGFCSAEHLLVSGDSGFEGTVDGALRTLGQKRRVVMSVHSYTLAPLIVAHSDLLTTLPRRLLEDCSVDLDLFEPPLALREVTLRALWHERTQSDPLNRWVREKLFAAFGSTAAAR